MSLPGKMRIVHVLPALTKGGAERVAVNLANHAASQGHDVTIVLAYPVDRTWLQDDISQAVEVRFVRQSPSRLGSYMSLLPWLAKNRGWLASQDIVHCHLTFGSIFGTAVQMLRSPGRCGPCTVETYHAVGTGTPKAHRFIHARLAAGRDAFALMAEDAFWTTFLARRPGLPSAIIPNGIDVNGTIPTEAERAAYRQTTGIPASARHVVGTVGRLVPERQPADFLRIFAEIKRTMGDDVHYLMGGAGPELARLQELAAEYGLEDNIHFPGLVTRPALAFSILDFYVSLNVGPITGLAALEAAASGLPVVSIQARSDYAAKPDDWIWSSPDPLEIGARVVALLQAASARTELAKAQQSHVLAHHTVGEMAQSYDVLYRLALAKR